MVLSGRIYYTSGRYSNFYVYCAKFQEENCRRRTSKIELAIGNITDRRYALFCYTYLPKKDKGGAKKKIEAISNILNVIFKYISNKANIHQLYPEYTICTKISTTSHAKIRQKGIPSSLTFLKATKLVCYT